MSTTFDNSWVEHYAQEVHAQYQSRGSKLRNTIRVKEGVVGYKCTFQKVGRGTAGKKTRHGNVPMMNLGHSNVSCTLEDWYAAEYIDVLDEVRSQSDDRTTAKNAGAWALGRKVDEMIITTLDKSSNEIVEGGTGLTKSKVLEAFAVLNANDVPDDGNRFAVVGPHQWNELLNIEEFKSSDFVGDEYAWLKGTESRKWLGTTWIFHNNLPITAGTRKCFMYHKTAVGIAEAHAAKAYVDWVPEKAAHLINHMITAGVCLIDANGCVEIQCDDDAVIV